LLVSDSSDRRLCSSFKYLEKISLGRGDPLLRVIGDPPSGGAPGRQIHPRQLVLRGCTSVVIGGMYRRLLKRCLAAITSALEAGKYSNATGQYEIICCAGCGVSELLWAILCEEISNTLSPPPQQSTQSHRQDLFSILIITIRSSIQERLQRVASVKNLPLVLSSLKSLCRQLSETYLHIPSLLLSNHQRSQGVGSFRVRRDLLLWKETLKRRLSEVDLTSGPREDFSFPFSETNDFLSQKVGIFSLGEAFFDGTCLPSLPHTLTR
jgi:hypothetical protein